jgi:hypothetical protein
MKTKRLNKKLQLNKVTVTSLGRDSQKMMKGGATIINACPTRYITVCYSICFTDCEGQDCLAIG